MDCHKNKCERIVALIFGSGSERIMAFDCTTISSFLGRNIPGYQTIDLSYRNQLIVTKRPLLITTTKCNYKLEMDLERSAIISPVDRFYIFIILE